MTNTKMTTNSMTNTTIRPGSHVGYTGISTRGNTTIYNAYRGEDQIIALANGRSRVYVAWDGDSKGGYGTSATVYSMRGKYTVSRVLGRISI